MNLHNLAKIILSIEIDGINKVRFAKTLYFVHKELIRRNVASSKDIEYRRMPLGPVPIGFMKLDSEVADIAVENLSTGLSYNASIYTLRPKKRHFLQNRWPKRDEGYAVIEDIMNDIRQLPTSVLVETSHEEPSWLENENGAHFFISEDDLSHQLPKTDKTHRFDEESEARHLQASLVSGMLKDIVDESTALEFPDEPQR